MMKITNTPLSLCLTSLIFACSSNTHFLAPGNKNSRSETSPNPQVGSDGGDSLAGGSQKGNEADMKTDGTSVTQPIESTGTSSESEILANNLRRDTFHYGPSYQQDKVDYLIVLDNSCSMSPTIDGIRSGFRKVMMEEGVFPKNAQIGVMSTMPGDNQNLSLVHEAVGAYTGIEFEPGFLALVNKEAIESYRHKVPMYSSLWKENGCNSWFSPKETSSDNKLCIEAHTQSTGYCVLAEAGITAFDQFVRKNLNTPIFHKGAVLNVIFVSDTHDPGAPGPFNPLGKSADLVQQRPTFEAMKKQVLDSQALSGFYLHAIAPNQPDTSCGDPFKSPELTYYDYAEAAGGQTANCSGSRTGADIDYSDFFRKMATTSKIANAPTFVLNIAFSKIESVTVDGQAVTDYEIRKDQQTIDIPGLDMSKDHEVIITYGSVES